jgi:NitT/TauT family transport system ATP-binding protein
MALAKLMTKNGAETILAASQENLAGDAKVRLSGVSKWFESKGTRTQALDGVSLSLSRGEFLCLVGPSGCGKSTLLNIVAGLETPSEGEILLDGRPVKKPGPDRVVVFQDGALFPWLNVTQNVEFGLKMMGKGKEERREQATKYLQMTHIAKFANHQIHELSGGMRQRVAIARALAMEPEILLMDEPFVALDAQARDTIHQELQEIWARTGSTIIFVTHNVREAVCLGERVIIMSYRPGRIKTEFRVDHPRPRHIEDPLLMTAAAEITRELKAEVERAVREEED